MSVCLSVYLSLSVCVCVRACVFVSVCVCLFHAMRYSALPLCGAGLVVRSSKAPAIMSAVPSTPLGCSVSLYSSHPMAVFLRASERASERQRQRQRQSACVWVRARVCVRGVRVLVQVRDCVYVELHESTLTHRNDRVADKVDERGNERGRACLHGRRKRHQHLCVGQSKTKCADGTGNPRRIHLNSRM